MWMRRRFGPVFATGLGRIAGRLLSRPQALPADLVHQLIAKVGLDEGEVGAMSKDEAVARMRRYWTEGE